MQDFRRNCKVFPAALIGLLFLAAARLTRHDASEPLDFKSAAWIWPYILGMRLISYLGSYGHGLGVLPHGADMAIIAVFSLAVLALALRLRLPDREAERQVNAEDLTG